MTSDANVDDPEIFKTWYPPLEKTVSCLSKLYHCLEPAVFTGLAQEAVEFCSISIQELLRRILWDQASLFDWSRSTSLSRTLSPRNLESPIDAKKVTAVKVARSSGKQDQKLDSVLGKPLQNQAFASPDKVAELIQNVAVAIEEELPKILTKMKLYLQKPSTRMILFKPIKTNIQLQPLLKSDYSAEDLQTIRLFSIEDLQAQLYKLL